METKRRLKGSLFGIFAKKRNLAEHPVLTEMRAISNYESAREVLRLVTRETLIFSTKDGVRTWAFGPMLKASREGLVLEFGTRVGRTARLIGETAAQLYTFDSFLGLRDPWSKPDRGLGAMSQNGVIPEWLLNSDRITVVQGWIEETLPVFLSQHLAPIAFVHFDLDVYKPTAFAMEQVKERLLPGATLVVDDYVGHIGFENHSYKAVWKNFAEEELRMIGYGGGTAVFKFGTSSHGVAGNTVT